MRLSVAECHERGLTKEWYVSSYHEESRNGGLSWYSSSVMLPGTLAPSVFLLHISRVWSLPGYGLVTSWL